MMGGRGTESTRRGTAQERGGRGNRDSARRYSGGGGGEFDFPVTFNDDFEVFTDAESDAAMVRFFRRKLTNAEIGRLVGAPDGAVIRTSVQGDGHLLLEVEHQYYTQKRRIYRDSFNALVTENDDFFKVKGAPAGVGSAVFANQVANSRRLGISEIRVLAAGSPRNPTMNGYYTWAVLGYDMEIFAHQKQYLPSEYKQARTLQDVLKGGKVRWEGVEYANGRDWWKANGWGFSGKFDLSDGSVSMEVLDEYLKRKKWKVPFKL